MALTRADVLSLSKQFLGLVSSVNSPSDVFCDIYKNAAADKDYKSLTRRARHACKAKHMDASKASLVIFHGTDNSFQISGSRAVATVCSPTTHITRVIFACIILLVLLFIICFCIRTSKHVRL